MPATIVFEDGVEIRREDPRTLPEARGEACARLAEARWRAETGGIAWRRSGDEGGAPFAVRTDRESQGMIAAAAARADRDVGFATPWKFVGPGGEALFTMLDAADLRSLRASVEEHVRACFAREGLLVQAVANAATREEADAVAW